MSSFSRRPNSIPLSPTSPTLKDRIRNLQQAQNRHHQKREPAGNITQQRSWPNSRNPDRSDDGNQKPSMNDTEWADPRSWEKWPDENEFVDGRRKANEMISPQAAQTPRTTRRRRRPGPLVEQQQIPSISSSSSSALGSKENQSILSAGMDKKIEGFLAAISKLAPPSGASKKEAEDFNHIAGLAAIALESGKANRLMDQIGEVALSLSQEIDDLSTCPTKATVAESTSTKRVAKSLEQMWAETFQTKTSLDSDITSSSSDLSGCRAGARKLDPPAKNRGPKVKLEKKGDSAGSSQWRAGERELVAKIQPDLIFSPRWTDGNDHSLSTVVNGSDRFDGDSKLWKSPKAKSSELGASHNINEALPTPITNKVSHQVKISKTKIYNTDKDREANRIEPSSKRNNIVPTDANDVTTSNEAIVDEPNHSKMPVSLFPTNIDNKLLRSDFSYSPITMHFPRDKVSSWMQRPGVVPSPTVENSGSNKRDTLENLVDSSDFENSIERHKLDWKKLSILWDKARNHDCATNPAGVYQRNGVSRDEQNRIIVNDVIRLKTPAKSESLHAGKTVPLPVTNAPLTQSNGALYSLRERPELLSSGSNLGDFTETLKRQAFAEVAADQATIQAILCSKHQPYEFLHESLPETNTMSHDIFSTPGPNEPASEFNSVPGLFTQRQLYANVTGNIDPGTALLETTGWVPSLRQQSLQPSALRAESFRDNHTSYVPEHEHPSFLSEPRSTSISDSFQQLYHGQSSNTAAFPYQPWSKSGPDTLAHHKTLMQRFGTIPGSQQDIPPTIPKLCPELQTTNLTTKCVSSGPINRQPSGLVSSQSLKDSMGLKKTPSNPNHGYWQAYSSVRTLGSFDSVSLINVEGEGGYRGLALDYGALTSDSKPYQGVCDVETNHSQSLNVNGHPNTLAATNIEAGFDVPTNSGAIPQSRPFSYSTSCDTPAKMTPRHGNGSNLYYRQAAQPETRVHSYELPHMDSERTACSDGPKDDIPEPFDTTAERAVIRENHVSVEGKGSRGHLGRDLFTHEETAIGVVDGEDEDLTLETDYDTKADHTTTTTPRQGCSLICGDFDFRIKGIPFC